MVRYNMIKLRQYGSFFLFFIAVFGFMPTTLSADKLFWIAATVLLVGSTLVDVYRKRIKLYVYKVYLMYVALIGFGILSMLWSTDITYTVNYLTTKFPIITLGVLCASAYMQDEQSKDRLFRLMVYAACIAALRYCLHTPWTHYGRGKFGILLDPNVNYNNYTAPLCLAFTISAIYALLKKQKSMYLPMVFLTGVLIVAGSRKTILIIPVVLLLCTVNQRNLRNALKAILISAAILAIAWYALMNMEILSQIRTSIFNLFRSFFSGGEISVGNSTDSRVMLTAHAFQTWLEHPVIGVGWNNYRYYSPLGIYSHNNYVETLACLGIIGFLLYYAIHLRTLYVEWCNRLKKKTDDTTRFILCTIIVMLMLDIGALPIYSREYMMICLIILTTQQNDPMTNRWELCFHKQNADVAITSRRDT